MFHRIFKLIFAGLIIMTGIWQMTEGYIGNGIFLIILSGIPIFLYFKNEFILLAFLRLRKQDFPGAQKWLAYIKNPETALVRKQQGYFNYLHGIMLSQTNLIQAEKYFKKAIELGLNMDMDLAVAKLNLAGVALTRRSQETRQAKHAQRTNHDDERANEKDVISFLNFTYKQVFNRLSKISC